MSSYSSTSLSSYGPASSSSASLSGSDLPSTPSTSPASTPPSPHPLKRPTSFPKFSAPEHPPPPPPHPQRTRALTLDVRPRGIGVDPSSVVGKQLTRVRRSRSHPCLTLLFADGSAFQVRVDGYDPHHRGVPKVLESDSPVLNPRGQPADLALTVLHAATITLADKAFQLRHAPPEREGRPAGDEDEGEREDRWTQRHAAFALKFAEEPGWHCVWATMAEYDDNGGGGGGGGGGVGAGGGERCVFRNYADVYLDRLHLPSTVPALAPPPPTSAPAHVVAFPDPAPEKRGEKGQSSPKKRKNWKRKPRADSSTPTPKARW